MLQMLWTFVQFLLLYVFGDGWWGLMLYSHTVVWEPKPDLLLIAVCTIITLIWRSFLNDVQTENESYWLRADLLRKLCFILVQLLVIVNNILYCVKKAMRLLYGNQSGLKARSLINVLIVLIGWGEPYFPSLAVLTQKSRTISQESIIMMSFVDLVYFGTGSCSIHSTWLQTGQQIPGFFELSQTPHLSTFSFTVGSGMLHLLKNHTLYLCE